MFPSFDTVPTLYWLTTFACSGLFVVRILYRPLSSTVFFICIGLILLAFRLSSIVYNQPLNPDEPMMLTQAMKLAVDPVFFLSVDGTTSGPLNSYILLIPHWLGLQEYDYISARLVGYVLLLGAFIFMTKALTNWLNSRVAQLALLPPVLALGLTTECDLLSYCSELVPLFLLTLALYQVSRLTVDARQIAWRSALLGLTLGAVPMAKLQGVPQAVVLGVSAAIVLYRFSARNPKRMLSALACLVAGGIAVPAVILLMVYLFANIYDDFYRYYIMANLFYRAGQSIPVWQGIRQMPDFLAYSLAIGTLAGCTLLLLLYSVSRTVLIKEIKLPTEIGKVTLLGGSLLVAGIYAVVRPGSEFIHYLYFLLPPIYLGLGVGFYILSTKTHTLSSNLPNHYSFSPSFQNYVILIGFWLTIGYRTWTERLQQRLNPYPSDHQGGWKLPETKLIKQVKIWGAPGEAMVVWGWRTDYNVLAQMYQGTAEAHISHILTPTPFTQERRVRYYKNFISSKPTVFIDTVGPYDFASIDRQHDSHEVIIPALGAYVQKNYTFVGEFDKARLYVRNDRYHLPISASK